MFSIELIVIVLLLTSGRVRITVELAILGTAEITLHELLSKTEHLELTIHKSKTILKIKTYLCILLNTFLPNEFFFVTKYLKQLIKK